MGNHNPEAWSAQANSQIGGTIGENRNERVLTWQQPPRTNDTACVRIMTESGIMLGRHRLLWVSYRAGPSTTARPEIAHPRSGGARQHTGCPRTSHVAKVFTCDATHQVHGRATTGEASEYLKKTLDERHVFVMACRAVESQRNDVALRQEYRVMGAQSASGGDGVDLFGHLLQKSSPVMPPSGVQADSDVSSGTRITISAMSQDGGYVRITQ